MKKNIQKISRYSPSIFQGTIDFRHAARSAAIGSEHPLERAALRALILALAACAALYIFFVGSSVLNVIARKEAIQQSAALASSVALMEREYFEIARAVSPEDGARLGLAPVSDTMYVHRPGNTAAAVTIGVDEI